MRAFSITAGRKTGGSSEACGCSERMPASYERAQLAGKLEDVREAFSQPVSVQRVTPISRWRAPISPVNEELQLTA